MLHVALKEWAVVCDLLIEGRLAMLLRKGGIHERGGEAVFELEHPRFALFPAWMHQVPNRLKPAYRERVVRHRQEPAHVTLKGMATVDHIWQVRSRQAFDSLDELHCFSRPQIDMRFNYKPERPLYLLAVRAYRLAEPRTIDNTPDYAGCRSWVPLRQGDAVDDVHATPALNDDAFAQVVRRIDTAMR